MNEKLIALFMGEIKNETWKKGQYKDNPNYYVNHILRPMIDDILKPNNMDRDKLIEILKLAYLWGRDNGEGRSDKNFNDFLETSSANRIIELEQPCKEADERYENALEHYVHSDPDKNEQVIAYEAIHLAAYGTKKEE